MAGCGVSACIGHLGNARGFGPYLNKFKQLIQISIPISTQQLAIVFGKTTHWSLAAQSQKTATCDPMVIRAIRKFLPVKGKSGFSDVTFVKIDLAFILEAALNLYLPIIPKLVEQCARSFPNLPMPRNPPIAVPVVS
jgi:hypothetical protein